METQKSIYLADDLRTLVTQNKLASAFAEAKRFDRAIPLFERTLAAYKTKSNKDDTHILYTQNELAISYQAAGKLDQAIPLFKQTLESSVARYGPDDRRTLLYQGNLADAEAAAGKPEQAIALLKQTLDRQTLKLGADDLDTIATMNSLAWQYRETHQFESAEPLFKQVWEKRTITLGSGDKETIDAEHHWGLCLAMMGRREEAEVHYQDSLEKIKKDDSAAHFWLGVYRQHLVELYDDWEKPEKAVDFLRDERGKPGNDELEFAKTLYRIGVSRLRKRMWDAAESVFRESQSIWERVRPDDLGRFEAESEVGASLIGQKKFAEAEPVLLSVYKGIEARASTIGPAHKIRMAKAAERLVELYDATGNALQSDRWRAIVKTHTARQSSAGQSGEIPEYPFGPVAPSGTDRQ